MSCLRNAWVVHGEGALLLLFSDCASLPSVLLGTKSRVWLDVGMVSVHTCIYRIKSDAWVGIV